MRALGQNDKIYFLIYFVDEQLFKIKNYSTYIYYLRIYCVIYNLLFEFLNHVSIQLFLFVQRQFRIVLDRAIIILNTRTVATHTLNVIIRKQSNDGIKVTK